MKHTRENIPAIWPWQKEIFLQLQYVPWIMLARDLDTGACLREAEALLEKFVVHRPGHQSGKGRWRSLSLRAVGGDFQKTYASSAYEGPASDYSFTEMAAHCPQTLRFLSSLLDLNQCERVRFMLLEPGAEVAVHSDAPHKATSLSFNIALNMPVGCEFWTDLNPDGSLNEYSKKIPVQAGSAFLFNTATYHKVVNHSAESRIHIIAHGPLRFTEQEMIEAARAQNSVDNLQQLTNLIVRKKSLKAEEIPADSALLADFLNYGFRPDVLPPFVALGLAVDDLLPDDMRRESVLISAAGLSNTGYEALDFSALEKWLQKKRAEQKKYAVVMAGGTFVSDRTRFMLELMQMLGRMEQERIPLAGHIMNREGQLPYLHEQFFIVNLEEWERAGFPAFRVTEPGGRKENFPVFRASPDCIHDNYTPLWIRGEEGALNCGKYRFGSEVMAALLRREGVVHNLPLKLRAFKDYIYPREGHEENYRRVKTKIEEFRALEYSRVFVFNTEVMRVEDFNFSPDVIIAPCSGFKPFSLMKNFGANCKKFLFLEKNPAAIQYYQALLACEKFSDVLLLQEQTLATQNLLPEENTKYVKRMVDAVMAELFCGEKSEFMACLKAISKIAQFACVDYLEEPEKIFAALKKDETVLFWHSNVWEFTPAYYERSGLELRQNYLELVRRFEEFFSAPALVHNDGFKAVLGADFAHPRIVLTQGGSRVGAPNRKPYQPLPVELGARQI